MLIRIPGVEASTSGMMATSEAVLQVIGGSQPCLFGSDHSFRKFGSSHTCRSFIRYRKKRVSKYVNFLNCSNTSYRAIRVDHFLNTRQPVHGNIAQSYLRSANCKCQRADSVSSTASENGTGTWFVDNDQSFDAVHGNTPSVLQFETVEELKVGEDFQSNGSLPPNGSVQDALNRIAENSIEDEAWELLRESMVYYCGSPVGTIAAQDPTSSNVGVLNYDQVFIRDFIPSGIAFLLKGEYEIVRNFILHTLQLQVKCYLTCTKVMFRVCKKIIYRYFLLYSHTFAYCIFLACISSFCFLSH